uniref:(northern house mosquito) hypothetical protein n=1 Tax=Culex pipiens TaxID=7175 RepID=A0A8D8MJG2_CULPI
MGSPVSVIVITGAGGGWGCCTWSFVTTRMPTVGTAVAHRDEGGEEMASWAPEAGSSTVTIFLGPRPEGSLISSAWLRMPMMLSCPTPFRMSSPLTPTNSFVSGCNSG